MKTENELIAEFMGLNRKEPGEYSLVSYWRGDPENKSKRHFVGYIDQLKYHERWDWLMPVVEKIEELYKKDFDPTEWVDSVLKGEPKKGEIKYMDVIALPLASKIDEAYKNVVEFIRWYNYKNS